jgi:hypothetical protein
MIRIFWETLGFPDSASRSLEIFRRMNEAMAPNFSRCHGIIRSL